MSQPTTAVENIDVLQNTTWQRAYSFYDTTGSLIDITNLSFTGSIREYQDAPGVPIATFNFTLVDSHTIISTLYPTQSANLVKTRYYYDVISVDKTLNPAVVTRVIQGKVNVGLAVTTL